MRYIKKSTKFQPRENRALTANNRPSVSAPVHLYKNAIHFAANALTKPCSTSHRRQVGSCTHVNASAFSPQCNSAPRRQAKRFSLNNQRRFTHPPHLRYPPQRDKLPLSRPIPRPGLATRTKRRNGAPITIAGAFFASAVSCNGGCAWETFGSAEFLFLGSPTCVQLPP